MKESDHPANINFERIRKMADGVAKYAGRDFRNETFLGYSLKDVILLTPLHADSISPDGKVKIDFAHWSLNDYPCNAYPNPETITQRNMSYVVSIWAMLEYEKHLENCNGYLDPGDPDGEFDLLDWRDDFAVSEGGVPDDVVEALCNYLKDQPVGYLSSDFEEEFLEGKLPKWDSRILKVVEEDIRKSLLEEGAYKANLAAESPEEKIHREEVMKMSSRTISSCWIAQEFYNDLATLMDCKKRRDETDDPQERDRIQSEMDYLISGGLATMEDVARSEMLDRENPGEL